MKICLPLVWGWFACVTMTLTQATSWGAVIVETSGTNDPLAAGFTHDANFFAPTVGPGTDTEPYWGIEQLNAGRGDYRLALDPALLAEPAGWKATVRVRSDMTGTNIQKTHLQVTDATDAWVIGLLNDGPEGPGAYLWNDAYAPGARIGDIDPAVYNTFEMLYDPTGDSGSGVVRYSVNGVDTGISQTRADVNADGPNRLVFGANTGGGGPTTQNWAHVRFEALTSHTVFETSGANDPTLAGFTLDPAPDPSGVNYVAGPDTDTLPHWHVSQVTGARNNYRYALDPTALQDPTGWTATFQMRAERTVDTPPGDYIQNVHAQVVDETDAWIIGLLKEGPEGPGAYVWNDNYAPGVRIADVDPADYHTYQLVFDPTADSGGGAVRFYVDGVDTGVVQGRGDVNADAPFRIVFGDNTGGAGPSDSRWATVRFETGQNVISPLMPDLNMDGVVDIFDVNIVSDNWGGPGPAGDANKDGIVDIFDVNVISDNWTTSGAAAVPEPAGIALSAVAMGALAFAARWRRRSASK